MLTVDDIRGWLEPVGIAQLVDADAPGLMPPGELIVIDLSSTGTKTGGEGQFRSPNFTLTPAAASITRLREIEESIEAVIPADWTGAGNWPVADPLILVVFVDFAPAGNGWQRRAIDNAERHIAAGQFTASLAISPA